MPSPSVDRRYPCEPFDPSLIREFLGERGVVSAELFPSGRTNTNYKLLLDDGRACVLRLYGRGSPERDARVMSLARGRVPVPSMLACGKTWAVFEFVDGTLLAECPEHSAAAAEALATISAVTFDSQGWVNADGTVSPFLFQSSGGFVGDILERPGVRDWLDSEVAGAIRALHQREAGRLAEMGAEAHLVHGDFNPTNVLLRQDEVVAILDWEWAHSNTPYMDIGNLLRNTESRFHPLIECGLKAGGMHLPGDWRQRAELIDLSSHLEFLTSNRSDEFKRTCVARIERCLAMFGRGT